MISCINPLAHSFEQQQRSFQILAKTLHLFLYRALLSSIDSPAALALAF